MGKIAKPVIMTFVRGPLHLIQAELTWIPMVNVFHDPRDKMVYAYRRDELTYFYDAEMSAQLTGKYDEVASLFKQNHMKVIGEVQQGIDNKE